MNERTQPIPAVVSGAELLRGRGPEARAELDALARLVEETPNPVTRWTREPAPPFQWQVEGLIPSESEVLLVGPGGTGKGFLELALAVHLALGRDLGPFKVPEPRGVLLVSLEDAEDVLHRRLEATVRAVLGHEPSDADLVALDRRLWVWPFRGVAAARLTPEFTELVAEQLRAGRPADAGLVILDPMARAMVLPEGHGLNSQEGAGAILNLIGRLVKAAGCSVLTAHHTNKRAQQEGQEHSSTAATGSQQLVDLSRQVLTLARVRNADAVGLPGAELVELRVSKSNGPPAPEGPHYFRRAEGGALLYAPGGSREATAARAMLQVLVRAERQLEAAEWEGLGQEPKADGGPGLSGNLAAEGRRYLVREGFVTVHGTGRQPRTYALVDGAPERLRTQAEALEASTEADAGI